MAAIMIGAVMAGVLGANEGIPSLAAAMAPGTSAQAGLVEEAAANTERMDAVPEGFDLNGFGWFEQNLGQFDDEVLWATQGPTFVALTATGLRIQDGEDVIRLRVSGATPREATVVEALSSKTYNWVPGASEASAAGIPHAKHLRLESVLSGIHFDLYITGPSSLEYDFVVNPGADPSLARLEVEGATPALEAGELVLGGVRFAAPFTYQGDRSDPEVVPSAYVLDGQTIRFSIGAYDPTRTLTIDPEMRYGTLFVGKTGQYQYNTEASDVYHREGVGYAVFGLMAYAEYSPHVTNDLSQGFYWSQNYPHWFMALFNEDDELEAMAIWGYASFGNQAEKVAIGPNGDIYTIGRCYSYPSTTYSCTPDNIGPGTATLIGTPSYYYSSMVAHFHWDGATLSAEEFFLVGGTGYYNYGWAVDVAENGDWAITGGAYVYTYYTPADLPIVGNGEAWHGDYGENWLIRFDQDNNILHSGFLGDSSYQYYYQPNDVGFDEQGNLYYTLTSGTGLSTKGALAAYQTNPGAYSPVIAKLDEGHNLEYRSYWGSSSYDYNGNARVALDVVREDEVVFAGPLAGDRAPVVQSTYHPTAAKGASYYYYNAFLAHLDMASNEVHMSWSFGGDYSDYLADVAYDATNQRYYVTGWSYRMAANWPGFQQYIDQAQQTGPISSALEIDEAYYTGWVMSVDSPAKRSNIDPARPADAQDQLINWATYIGTDRRYSYVHGMHLSDMGEVFLAWEYLSYGDGSQFPPLTTKDALERRSYANEGVLWLLEPARPIPIIDVNDFTTQYSTPAVRDAPLTDYYTMTWTEVWLQGRAIALEDPVDEDTWRWDLDNDGAFDDHAGRYPSEPIFFYEKGSQIVCLRIDGLTGRTSETCVRLIFKNRAPVPVIEVLSETPYNRVDPVWFDASNSFDLDGTINWTTAKWDFGGIGVPSGELTVQALFQYQSTGTKEVWLAMEDNEGLPGVAVRTIEVVNLVPQFSCSLGSRSPSVGGWLELDVTAAKDRDGEIAGWTLTYAYDEPVEGEAPVVVSGKGAPPARIATNDHASERFARVGAGTAVLEVRDNEGGVGSCSLPYVVEPGRLLADFTLDRQPLWAGFNERFTDTSYTPNGVVIDWHYTFGDGTESFVTDPVHVFGRPGVYNVTLTVDDGFAIDSTTKSIEVVEPPRGPSVALSISDGPYYPGTEVTFNNLTRVGSEPIVAGTWIIEGPHGFRETFPAVGPSAVFRGWAALGSYTVSLEIVDANGYVITRSLALEVQAFQETVPEYHTSLSVAQVGEPVVFTDVSTTGAYQIEEWAWDFRDGTGYATGPVVTHAFSEPGLYQVTMTITDEAQERYFVSHEIEVVSKDEGAAPAEVTAQIPLPVAAAGPDRTVSEGSVLRLDGSKSAVAAPPAHYAWRQVSGPVVEILGADTVRPTVHVPFFGRDVEVRFELTVSDQYGVSAPDTVRLFVRSEGGDDLGVLGDLDARFRVRDDGAGRLVFDAVHQPLDAVFHWDFGDGAWGEGQRVQHQYMKTGTFFVTLTVEDAHGRVAQSSQTVMSDPQDAPRADEGPVLESDRRIGGMAISYVLFAGLFVAMGLLVGAVTFLRRP